MSQEAFDIGKLTYIRNLGTGKYAKVKAYRVPSMFKNFEKWKPLVAKQVAIKIFEVQEKESFKHEKEVLRNLRNESGIIKYFLSEEVGEKSYIVMQCGIEDLKTFSGEIRKRLHPEDAIRTLMKNFLTGLITLHEKKHMVHQDIKPKNIILTNKSKLECVLSDFGTVYRIGEDKVPTWVQTTYRYAAPEQLEMNFGDPLSDVWSSGITFLVVSIDPKRLKQNQGVTIGEVLQGIRSGKTLELFRANSPLFKIEAAEDLFLGMLETNKEYRFSAREAYNHPFIQGTKYTGPLRKTKLQSGSAASKVDHLSIEQEQKKIYIPSGENIRKVSIPPRPVSVCSSRQEVDANTPGTTLETSVSGGVTNVSDSKRDVTSRDRHPSPQRHTQSKAHTMGRKSTVTTRQKSQGSGSNYAVNSFPTRPKSVSEISNPNPSRGSKRAKEKIPEKPINGKIF